MIHSFNIAHRKQAGITLVETAIALAIAAVVVSAAFAGFQANARRSEVRDNSQLISEMIADAKQLFGPTNRYSSMSTPRAIAARIIPTNMLNSTETAAFNSYGGAVTFDAAGSATDTNDQAKMVFSEVPKNQCVDLALSIERNLAGMIIHPNGLLENISRTASDGTNIYNAKPNNASPGDVAAQVASACTQASANGKYDLHLFFTRN